MNVHQETSIRPPLGIFEGYMKKRKNIAALTLISDCNKRYFYLDLSTCTLVYYKNRKKSGKVEQIPLREILGMVRMDDETINVISGKEWVYQFYLVTRSRSYDLRAYSWNDREVWMKALNRILDYKRMILARRGVNLGEVILDLENIPNDQKYDFRSSDFGLEGKLKPIIEIPIEEVKQEMEQN
jgi:hypothetical protein